MLCSAKRGREWPPALPTPPTPTGLAGCRGCVGRARPPLRGRAARTAPRRAPAPPPRTCSFRARRRLRSSSTRADTLRTRSPRPPPGSSRPGTVCTSTRSSPQRRSLAGKDCRAPVRPPSSLRLAHLQLRSSAHNRAHIRSSPPQLYAPPCCISSFSAPCVLALVKATLQQPANEL